MKNLGEEFRKETRFYLIQASRTIGPAKAPRESLTLCIVGKYNNELIKGYITLDQMQMLQLMSVLSGKVEFEMIEKPKDTIGFKPPEQ